MTGFERFCRSFPSVTRGRLRRAMLIETKRQDHKRFRDRRIDGFICVSYMDRIFKQFEHSIWAS